MNVSGKSLQDIYDAGAKRLEELETAQSSSMNDTAEAHLDERSRVEPESLKRLEERTEELESEIRAYLDRGLERVERAVVSEGQESERHISRLVESLVLLSKKFSESISRLRESAESELSDLASDSHHLYKSNSESANNQLRDESSAGIDASHQVGSQSESSVEESVDQHWDIVYDTELDAIKDVSDVLEKGLDRLNSKSIETKRGLEEIVDQKLLRLEGQMSQSSDNLRSMVDTVTEQAERHAFDADVRLKEKFSSLLYEMSTSFDDSATRVASDIAGLHEASMADLKMKSQELSREMDSLAEDVTNGASTKSGTLQEKGTSLLRSFTDELEKRLEASNVFLKEIEGERAAQVSEIWNELTEVKTKFEEKLSQLAQSTLDKMQSICDEAEKAVFTAQQNCLTDSKNHAQTRKETIEKETNDFLGRINSTRQSALDAIAKAAGAMPEEEAPAETKSSKKDKAKAAEEAEKKEAAAESSNETEEEGVMANPRPGGEETMIDGDNPSGRRRRNKGKK